MNAILLSMLLDLTAAHAAPNLELTLSVPSELPAQRVTPVRITLRNQGTRSVRVVAETCWGPFAVLIDGKPHNSGRGCDDDFARIVDLEPGASTGGEVLVALPPGRHRLTARYAALGDGQTFAGPLESEPKSVKATVRVVEVDVN
jgi:hypothetical protein